MKIIIENPTKDWLHDGHIYHARFDGPLATRKEMDLLLCKDGFSSPADGKKRFLKPIDPLFWLHDGAEELEIECEAIQK